MAARGREGGWGIAGERGRERERERSTRGREAKGRVPRARGGSNGTGGPEGRWVAMLRGWRRQRANLIFAPLAMPLPPPLSSESPPRPLARFPLTHNSPAHSLSLVHPLYALVAVIVVVVVVAAAAASACPRLWHTLHSRYHVLWLSSHPLSITPTGSTEVCRGTFTATWR